MQSSAAANHDGLKYVVAVDGSSASHLAFEIVANSLF
jgi:hypothetical protein